MAGSILVVDDDADVRDSVRALLESAGYQVEEFASARDVLALPDLVARACLIADIRMPDMDGLSLQEELVKRRVGLPVIIVTGHGDVPLAVRAMKAGAVDFLEKPFDDELLLQSVSRALAAGRKSRDENQAAQEALARIEQLTARERQVLEHLIAGHANKAIAHALAISPRTVEIHRANVMAKMQVRTLSEVVRLALAAGVSPAPKR